MIGVVVLFGEAPRRRVTGWAVACTAHGAMPVLLPGRAQAMAAAVEHVRAEHGDRGEIVESRRPLREAKRRARPERPTVSTGLGDVVPILQGHRGG